LEFCNQLFAIECDLKEAGSEERYKARLKRSRPVLDAFCAWLKIQSPRSQNSQLNVKIHPSAVRGLEGARKLLDLTRAYMRAGGTHIQYNIVDSRMLRDAQQHPDRYRDLMVRVAGFTQYWVEIGKHIQDAIIARTEYERV
jgi:4-hydroxyphenylacetate decarboxylase large subunit